MDMWEIIGLEPGEELDALVAEIIMGWRKILRRTMQSL